MPGIQKRRRDIDGEILRFLFEEDWPVTTEMVAKRLKISWNTAQVHLYKLTVSGLVKGKKVGRQNQWMITEKGRELLRKKRNSAHR